MNPSQADMSADLLRRVRASTSDEAGYGITKTGVDVARTGLQFTDPA